MRQWVAGAACNSAGIAVWLTACAVAEVDSTRPLGRDPGDTGITPEQDASRDAADSSAGRDASTSDGTVDATVIDSGLDQVVTDAVGDIASDAVTDAPNDGITGPCQTPPGICAATLPVGWTLVVLQPDRSAACTAGFTQRDVIANPIAGSGACDCACNAPASACSSGQLPTRYGTTTACSSSGASISVNGTGCTVLSGNFSDYFSATPLPGGACTASTVTDTTKVTSTEQRVCEAPSSCHEDVCNGRVPAGSSACIGRDGDLSCPAGWSARRLVGTDVSLSCSSCTCGGSASCTNARINFFSDVSCATPLISFAVDGSCQPTNAPGAIGSFSYAATAGNQQCMPNGSRTATIALTGTRTLCCK
jgi:hypothetical protein